MMQSDQQFPRRKSVPHFGNQSGNDHMHVPIASSFAPAPPLSSKHLMSVHGIEFQPSEVCPKNFIIFDQTDHRSQIMFHPTVAHKFSSPGLGMHASYVQENFKRKMANDIEKEVSSSLKENSDDIDALLSLEEDEEDGYDEEEVSTARTYGNYGSSSPDSCSTYGSKPRKNGSSSVQSSSGSGSSCNSERKRQKMKKMVKALRGIVPGSSDQMNTVTVLDEAVRYLKSLKVEVQKLGVGNLEN
ncbi:transcription factor bHLH144 [Mercurialis annua]|uniref:transcription factor bHLH144 n=1 Tax=Mercurialis annua TaxID=3986 RepID=UPI002160BDA1|nr:transcription factor bHLH144 [Mercurialis annua]